MAEDKNWMRGYCWDMGLALAKITKLPLYGIFDAQGTCHHAFVYDKELQMGIDGRGAQRIDRLVRGFDCFEIKPLDRADIEKEGGWLGRPLAKEEISAAVRFANKSNLLLNWNMAKQIRARVSQVVPQLPSQILTPIQGM